MSFWNKAAAITWKDIISEMRSKEVLYSVLVFAILVIVIFSFAFGTDRDTISRVASGMLWVTFTFSGVLSLNRAFVPEKEENCLEGLMVCPISREVIYVGKLLGSLVFMLVVEAISLPVFAFLFNLPVLSFEMAAIVFLATVGFVSVGILFSALAVNTRARELVLPILFLPIVVPVIICAVKASDVAIGGGSWGELAGWLQVLAAFDLIFMVVSFLTFSYVIEE